MTTHTLPFPSSTCRLLSILVSISLLHHVQSAMYGDNVIELTSSNFDKIVMESAETFMVKFYAPWCGHCQSSAPAYSKAAKKLDGVAKLGVVNCDEHSSLAQRFGVSGFPTIKIFKGEGRKARRPSDYNQERSSKAFVDHVKYVMPSFVARVKPSGTDAFFKDEPKLPHVLLFTDKTSTSPLYKGMSARFKGRISFGEVRKSDAADLEESYQITNYPTLLFFKTDDEGSKTATPFEGTMDPTSLNNFFESIAAGKEPEKAKEPDQAEKVFAQPKAYSGDVPLISSSTAYEEQCGARKDGRMCGLAFLAGGETHDLFGELKGIAEKYQYDNMAFAVIDTSDEGGKLYADVFKVSAEVGGFLVMRARKKKYALLEGDDVPTKDKIAAFLDKIVGGDARFKKLSENLPEWGSEEEAKEGGEQAGSGGEQAESGEGDADSGSCGMTPPEEGGTCGGEKEDL
eukprot:GFKZ01009564.1.p1 GENE.GFKZ01009564.1~~GFKZ01009564.1.p1  ORF type:complete len:457 (-),score=89.89 GFKZ01009564.1:340-1710(-)